jgi:hypothetical protein
VTLWEERAARNEALFREVNEEVARLEQRLEGEDASFVCECADESCVDRVQVTLTAYERVRAHPRRFIVARGHEAESVEQVVSVEPGYTVVEKTATAGAVAERLS